MKSSILVDTGLLVAIVNRREASHQWAIQATTNLPYPFLTCEDACLVRMSELIGDKIKRYCVDEKLR